MDMKLRTAMMNLQMNFAKASRELDQSKKDSAALMGVGRAAYKTVVRLYPDLADNPVVKNFRIALDIPEGADEPVNPNPPQDDSKAAVEVLEAVNSINTITTFTALTPETRAAVLEQLETALLNARAHLDLSTPPE